MPGLSEQDPRPGQDRGRPPIVIAAIIVVLVIAVVVLHLTGVVGPGSH
jgi:hypothetical protein